MKIDFYHWNYQCPINNESIDLLNQYKKECEISIYDITENPELSKAVSMYFPFITIFDEKHRWKGPLNKRIIERFLSGEIVKEEPFEVILAMEEFQGELIDLNSNTVDLLSVGCTMNNSIKSCRKKGEFLASTDSNFFGLLHLSEGKVVGGVEFLPSLKAPYNIPKNSSIAFLTCLYHSSEKYDFKSYPLRELEKRLAYTYDTIIAITDEKGTFPNGSLEWFKKQGYIDCGVISEEDGYCRLHLVSKKID